MINALTFDLEFWWCSKFLKGIDTANEEDCVEESLQPVLDLLEDSSTKATFFVLGELAERFPKLVESIQKAGHEIACHGYSHETIGELGKVGFSEDIRKSSAILESITGKKPIGYRAPNFSLDKESSWALKILEESGFLYDSSIFPVSKRLVGLYGVPDAPIGPYHPSKSDVTKPAKTGIMEFPLTVYKKLGINLPAAGGFYLRTLPLWILRRAIAKANREGRPAVIYLHPWETYPGTPKREKGLVARFKRRYGMGKALGKLESLLKDFTFSPIRDHL